MSPVRWLRAVAVIGATALLMASSCSWQLGTPIPEGVPPPAGDPVPEIDTHAEGRPADQLHEWAAERAPALGIPVTALEAYAYAARVAEVENPDCHLAWTTLAGIGQVESHHGTYRGATIAPNGDVTPPIRGVRLDGTNGNLRDHRQRRRQARRRPGASTARWGRCSSSPRRGSSTASTPTTTASSARTTSTTRRCRRPGTCAGAARTWPRRAGWMEALRAYNLSDQYARTVRDWATAYADGHPL